MLFLFVVGAVSSSRLTSLPPSAEIPRIPPRRSALYHVTIHETAILFALQGIWKYDIFIMDIFETE